MTRTRALILAAGIAALAALILLSGGLAELRLAAGSQLPVVAHETEGDGSGGAALRLDEAAIDLIAKIVLFCVPVLLLALIIALIVSPEMRKDTLSRLLLPILFLGYLYFVRDKYQAPPEETPTAAVPADSGAAVVSDAGPTVTFDANPPETVVWGTRIAVGIGVALVVGGALWLLWRSRRSPESRPLQQVAEQARQAIGAIQSGADVRNVVLRCYFEMSRVLSEEKGLMRQSTMTPREFERSLAAVGLPQPAVQRLTRLFEGVRYGSKTADGDEEEQAILSLTAIVDACRGEA